MSSALLLPGRMRFASEGGALEDEARALVLVGETECELVGCFDGFGEELVLVKAPPPPPTGGGGTFVVAGGVDRGLVECALEDGAGDVGGAGVLELGGGGFVDGCDVGLGSVVTLNSPPTLSGPPTETFRPSRLSVSRCPC